MNIGIVTTWFESGAGSVSRQYKQILEKSGNNIYVFVRGGYYAIGDPIYDTPEVTWSAPSPIPIVGSLNIEEFKSWIERNKLEVVFFNEQVWWPPVLVCIERGIKCGAYVDYYTEQTTRLFDAYDFLICNTHRHYNVFKDHYQSYYVPWGTDTEIFQPHQNDLVNKGTVTFFHSSGSDPFRKGCDLLLKSFSEVRGNVHLVIHSQANLKRVFPGIKRLISKLESEKKLEIITETVGAPGLYHLGDIYVYPSRLDGIGLSMAEALSCGLVLITSDNGPMNEFVEEGCGTAVKIKQLYKRKDNYYWPICEVDIVHLTKVMQEYTDNPDQIPQLKKNARNYAREKLNWSTNRSVIDDIFHNSVIIDKNSKVGAIKFISSYEKNRTNKKIMMFRMFPRTYKSFHKVWRLVRDSKLKSSFSRSS
jgi:1,2-diacylglycerol 3-alpha-glucosyltransferase